MPDPFDEHYSYLSDRVKVERYQAAIKRAVNPGAVVMDLGCGSGLLGLMALRAGAGKVLFVEEGPIIEVARRTISEAGFMDLAEFHHTNSYQLDLPEGVDVVICDHVGYLGFDYNILPLLADARERFLKPGGILMPGEIELELAPVESGEGREFVGRWRDGSIPADFAWVGSSAANTKHALQLEAANLLAHPTALATLELGADAEAFYSWQVECECSRDGGLDGLLGWFDCRLFDDIRMTNSPAASDRIYRPQAFLPLDERVSVRAGDTVCATLMARPDDHILAWTAELPNLGEKFSQSTFGGLLLDAEALERSHSERIAKLNERGHAQQVILSYCDGKRTIAEIEAIVRDKHADLFPSARATERFVRQVLTRDTTG